MVSNGLIFDWTGGVRRELAGGVVRYLPMKRDETSESVIYRWRAVIRLMLIENVSEKPHSSMCECVPASVAFFICLSN